MVLNLKADPAPIDLSAFNIEPGLPADTSTSAPSYATKDFDITRLEGLEILIFGAGSVGSYILWALAMARLIIHLFDSKKVEPKHAQSGRTIYDSTQIGQFKVYAAKEKIEKNFIGTTVFPAAYNVAEIPDIELIERFKKAALVIVVIDDPAQIIRINHLCYPLTTAMIQCGIHRQGHSSHIAFTMPHQTPCLACTLGIHSERDIHRLDTEPAAGIDISIAAQLAARIALDILYSKVTGKPITRWNATKNLLFITNTQQTTPDGPGIEYESGQRRPDCLICR
jgi:molybdopterin/thiamine biosynthesis adenylyltransferase